MNSLRCVACFLSFTAFAHASTLFDFTAATDSEGNSYGNTLSLSVGGLTVTESAWYLASGYTSASTFGKAAVDDYNGTNLGLGVCSPNDPSGAACSSPYHQVDNQNGNEFIMFKFSQAVNLSNVKITNYQAIGSTGDVDLTYYTASSALTTGTTLGSLGTGTTITQSCSGTSCVGTPFIDTLSGTNVTYLIVSAAITNTDGNIDSFKLNSLTVNATTATPEPGTLGTVALMGLLAFVWAGRRPRPVPVLNSGK